MKKADLGDSYFLSALAHCQGQVMAMDQLANKLIQEKQNRVSSNLIRVRVKDYRLVIKQSEDHRSDEIKTNFKRAPMKTIRSTNDLDRYLRNLRKDIKALQELEAIYRELARKYKKKRTLLKNIRSKIEAAMARDVKQIQGRQ